MMIYLKDLEWQSHQQDFNRAERRIMLALSDARGEWLTMSALRKTVNLREQDFADALTALMSDGLIRVGVSENWVPILGLTERVGPSARPVKRRGASNTQAAV